MSTVISNTTHASPLSYSSSSSSSHPDWVNMDVGTLGKSLYNSEEAPLNEQIKPLKIKALEDALKKNENENSERSLEFLSELSRCTDGLINNELRSKIWPILLGINSPSRTSSSTKLNSLESSQASLEGLFNGGHKLGGFSDPASFLDDLNCVDLPQHKDEDQVKLDIQRSFTILNHIQSLQHHASDSYTTIFSPADVSNLKKKLSNLIIKLLRRYPSLNYYQGFHDIASIVLLVCYTPEEDEMEDKNDNEATDYNINEDLAFKILEKLAIFHLRDYMTSDINLSVNHLKLIPLILENVDLQLFELIKQTSNSYIQSDGLHYDYKFFQGLSSILTFYSHDLTSLPQILAIWDFTISYNSVLPNMYIYASALLVFKEKIFTSLQIDDDTNYEDVDPDLVHTAISPNRLFEELSDSKLLEILNRTKTLLNDFPINRLTNSSNTWAVWFEEYNKNSVLLTTSNLYADKNDTLTKYQGLIIGTIFESFKAGPTELSELIHKQEQEITRQIIDDAAFQRKILDQQEELSNSIFTESSPSLSSSSATLHTATSTLHKVASSIFFKKLFAEEVDEEKKKHHREWSLTKNIYKISITVGFIGFVIHFLLIKHNSHYPSILSKFITMNIFGPLKRIAEYITSSDSVAFITQELGILGGNLIDRVEDSVNDVYSLVKDSTFVNSGMGIGQVGLGNLRNTVYGFHG
ncbi:GYP8 [[Candida] subhashii]|uniref:GYP8 n=1 Tax=[Candida] subhashii TaxID=561895 RepID=A0A8J5QE42_9ASCO|nr:GYP8 [[Candida] subhashii]KAG7664364.1 GYP8 [[Candida] subhashii]